MTTVADVVIDEEELRLINALQGGRKAVFYVCGICIVEVI